MGPHFTRRVVRLLGAGLLIGGLALLVYVFALVFGDFGDEALPGRILEPLLTVMPQQEKCSPAAENALSPGCGSLIPSPV